MKKSLILFMVSLCFSHLAWSASKSCYSVYEGTKEGKVLRIEGQSQAEANADKVVFENNIFLKFTEFSQSRKTFPSEAAFGKEFTRARNSTSTGGENFSQEKADGYQAKLDAAAREYKNTVEEGIYFYLTTMLTLHKPESPHYKYANCIKERLQEIVKKTPASSPHPISKQRLRDDLGAVGSPSSPRLGSEVIFAEHVDHSKAAVAPEANK